MQRHSGHAVHRNKQIPGHSVDFDVFLINGHLTGKRELLLLQPNPTPGRKRFYPPTDRRGVDPDPAADDGITQPGTLEDECQQEHARCPFPRS